MKSLSVCLLFFVVFAGCGADPVVTKKQLRTLSLACLGYESENNQFPMPDVDDESDPLAGRRLGWRVQILPFLKTNTGVSAETAEECSELYKKFKHDEPWDTPHNLELVKEMPAIFKSDHHYLELGKTLFARPKFSAEMAQKHPKLRPVYTQGDRGTFGDITDGSSNTILIVEVNPDCAVTWTAPEDWDFQPGSPKAGLGKAWPDKILMAFCDGSTHAIENNISDELLQATITKSGGEVNTIR